MTKKELIDYISARDFAVIATKGDDFPESACIQFGNDGLTLIFDTDKASRKFQNIQKSPKVSLVIGWEDERTVQYEGIATLLSGDELERLKKAYFAKSAYAEQWQKEGTAYFKVEPVWIRFSDLNTTPYDITVFDV
jgi:nitroimidazol reductase NimA-like FMN-containing flavoprotein (pyridoxamine 5'-phosphate oxidase superfamily)